MALEENVATLEGIDESYHDLYVENSEGTFDINIAGLKTALNKERINRKKLEKQLTTKTTDVTDEDLQNQLKEAQTTIKSMKVNGTVKSIALKSGVNPDYIDDVMTLTKGNFELSDDGEVIVVDNTGAPTGQTLDRFFNGSYKKSKPGYYVGSGKSGSGFQSSMANADPNSYNGQLEKAIAEGNTMKVIALKNKNLK